MDIGSKIISLAEVYTTKMLSGSTELSNSGILKLNFQCHIMQPFQE